MRESVGSTWTLQLVIGFILLFVAFLTLSLSYSKSYKIRNETLSIIEKYEGLTSESIGIINNYMTYSGYKATGNCPDGWYGVEDLASTSMPVLASSDKKYYYCVAKHDVYHKRSYYELKVFFKFNIPVLGDFTTFSITGTTIDFISADSYSSI